MHKLALNLQKLESNGPSIIACIRTWFLLLGCCDNLEAAVFAELAGFNGTLGRQMWPTLPQGQKRECDEFVVRWEGPVVDSSSFSVVAQELGSALLASISKCETVQFLNTKSWGRRINSTSKVPLLSTNEQHFTIPDVTIQMLWPPKLVKPSCAAWIIYLPWEFHAVPEEWVRAFQNSSLTEIWVPSTGIAHDLSVEGLSHKVHVIPHGVNFQKRCPSIGKMSRVRSNKPFVFLYVGAGLWRKGVDLLLEAYFNAFSKHDNVLLTILSTYGTPDVFRQLQHILSDHDDGPKVNMIRQALSDEDMRQLFATADAYVHPARSEGYGLTIAEAMACGIPVIVSGSGSHREFVNDRTGFLVKGQMVTCHLPPCAVKKGPNKAYTYRVFGLDVAQPPTWFEVNSLDLARVMQFVHENYTEALKKSFAAAHFARNKLTWSNAAVLAWQRLRKLKHDMGDM